MFSILSLQLQHFQKFDDTTIALAAITGSIEGKIPKPLKKLLKKIQDDTEESLLVADSKLGNTIKVLIIKSYFPYMPMMIRYSVRLSLSSDKSSI